MNATRLLLGTALLPLLSGCLMWGGGMGHMGGTGWMDGAGHPSHGQLVPTPQRAEATVAGLRITLSFPTPRVGTAVAIDARLVADSASRELPAADIWLRIETPGGAVEQIRMLRPPATPAGAYQAQYSFPVAGPYLVTAEGRVGSGADARTVSVTARAQADDHAHGDSHHAFMPAALVGGLVMTATMVLMMGGSWF